MYDNHFLSTQVRGGDATVGHLLGEIVRLIRRKCKVIYSKEGEFRICHALLLTLREKPGFRWCFFSQYSYYGYLAVFRQQRIQTFHYLDKYCFNQSESR